MNEIVDKNYIQKDGFEAHFNGRHHLMAESESGHWSMGSTTGRNTLFIGTNAQLSTGRSEISDLF